MKRYRDRKMESAVEGMQNAEEMPMLSTQEPVYLHGECCGKPQ